MVEPLKTAFKIQGKLGDKVYGFTMGKQWVRAHFIPPNPKTAPQQNNRHAFRLVNLLFAAEPEEIKQMWAKKSTARRGSKTSLFVSRGMLTYIDQIGVSGYPESVTVVGVYPGDMWLWEET